MLRELPQAAAAWPGGLSHHAATACGVCEPQGHGLGWAGTDSHFLGKGKRGEV